MSLLGNSLVTLIHFLSNQMLHYSVIGTKTNKVKIPNGLQLINTKSVHTDKQIHKNPITTIAREIFVKI